MQIAVSRCSCSCFLVPQLAALIGSPEMQRYLKDSASQTQTDVTSPYFLPPTSLLVSVNVDDPQPGRPAQTSPAEEATRLKGDLHMIVNFHSLLSGSFNLTMKGCGSLATRRELSLSGVNSVIIADGEQIQLCEASTECRTGVRLSKVGEARRASTAEILPPRCIQLLVVRYRQELIIRFSAFQQLLHLFMQYITQCRQAYEQQRQHNGLMEEAPGNSALATPDFCEFGPQLEVHALAGSGVVLEFLSLVAVHDGKDRLEIQWAEAVSIAHDPQRRCFRLPMREIPVPPFSCENAIVSSEQCFSFLARCVLTGRSTTWSCVCLRRVLFKLGRSTIHQPSSRRHHQCRLNDVDTRG